VNIEQQVEARVNAFASELTELVRALSLELVSNALRGGAAAPRAAVVVAAAAAGKARSPKAIKAGATSGKSGRKRDPRLLAALVERVAEHILANPDRGAREIATAVGSTTHDIELPIQKLLAARRIKKTGQRDKTRYFKA
jgi:hypothetical protein